MAIEYSEPDLSDYRENLTVKDTVYDIQKMTTLECCYSNSDMC